MDETPDQSSEQSDALGGGAFGQAEIDASVNDSREGATADESHAPGENPAPGSPELTEVSQADIDALLSASGAAGKADASSEQTSSAAEPDVRVDTMARPFEEAAAAGTAPPSSESSPVGSSPPDNKPFEFPELGDEHHLDVDPRRVTMLNDVNLRVKLQLGRTRMLVEDVLKLSEGSVVELDKLAGDPIDVLVNERLIARGEVLVLNDVFCVRISEVLSNDPHRVIV